MENKITIKVKKKHIIEGRPGSPNSCPIARAIKDDLNLNSMLESGTVAVGTTIIRFGKCSFEAPDEAREFVKNFDRQKEGKPFQFSLDLDKRTGGAK